MVHLRDTQSLKVNRHSWVCIYRLCRFSVFAIEIGLGRIEDTNEIPIDIDLLDLVPFKVYRQMNVDFVYKLPDERCAELDDLRCRIFTYFTCLQITINVI